MGRRVIFIEMGKEPSTIIVQLEALTSFTVPYTQLYFWVFWFCLFGVLVAAAGYQ